VTQDHNSHANQPLIEVDHLSVTFYTPRGTVRAVRDASFHIERGQVVGLVGESGCGKSTVALALMGYLPGTTEIGGSRLFAGEEIAQMGPEQLRKLRGNSIAMVYQDPATSLNPTMRVGPQVEEVLQHHLQMTRPQAREKTAELFASVNLADPERIGNRYPHELSGGQQQRVVIAMALACEPDLLIMDEPTTGLDVTTEATILDLVVDLKTRLNAGILYVSHNLGVIARVADRVVVMYAGQTIEEAEVRDLFKAAKHPYTAGLLSCVPAPVGMEHKAMQLSSIPGSVFPASLPTEEACLFASRCPMAQERCKVESPGVFTIDGGRSARCFFWNDIRPGIWGEDELRPEGGRLQAEPVLTATNLRKRYGHWQRKYLFFGPRIRPPVRALTDVSFEVGSGRTLGIVGESGSGKTTAARVVVGLSSRDGGALTLREEDMASEVQDRTRSQRAAVRMVFQNPRASLNPKLPIRHAILRALRKFAGLGQAESRERARELMEAVGLSPEYLDRPPTELSGGQQQRVALAGAFAANPELVVLDEAVSALDVSVQAQVLNLLDHQQEDTGTSHILISHDLGVVRYLSDDIMVLYAGHLAEYGPAENVLGAPWHPYTEALLSAAPVPDPNAPPTRIRLPGAVPTMRERFQGCFFAGRCPRKLPGDICDSNAPPARTEPDAPQHVIYCHIPLEELTSLQLAPDDK
jgi:peptide/nickel transport system ATP-binding protein